MITLDDPIQVLFLDFDGVIVESLDIKTDAFREYFQEYPDQLKDIMAYHLGNNGLSRLNKFRHIYENILGLSYEEADREVVEKRFSELVFDRVVTSPPVSGAIALLEEFYQRLPIVVVSASPAEELVRVIEAREWNRYFRYVFGAPGIKSNFIQNSLEMLDLLPANAVFVGDSPEDFKAAQISGVRFIGRQNQEEFTSTSFPIFPDMTEILELLRLLLGDTPQ